MEIIPVVEAVDTGFSALGSVVKFVNKILQARRDVANLHKDIDDLFDEVEVLKQVTDKIEATSSVEDKILKLRLEKLEIELDRASQLLDKFKEKQKHDKSSAVSKVAKAAVNKGDAKRKKKITATHVSIKDLRVKLESALQVTDHVTVQSTYSTVQSTHSIATKVQFIGESSHTIIQETHNKVDQVYQKIIVDASSGQIDIVVPQIPEVITQLDALSRECVDNESYKVHHMVWDGEKNEYRLPDQEDRSETTGEDDGDHGDVRRAGAREGGWEVKNGTKIQLRLEAHRDCFFYLLSYAKPVTTPTDLELFFPKYSSQKHKILSRTIRRFPDTSKYKRTDPMSCKVDKTLDALRLRIEGQVLFYIIFSEKPLVTLDKVKEADVNDFIQQLNLKDQDVVGGDTLSLCVKRILFDVK